MFVSLLIRNKWLTLSMFVWAAIPSYSRIYLGVHYPGDILAGALEGCLIALLVYQLYRIVRNRFFDQPKYISSQYTSSGYSIDDVGLIHLVLLLSYLYAIIAGMITAKVLYL